MKQLVKFGEYCLSNSLVTLGGFIYISVFMGDCGNSNTKSTDCMCRLLIGAMNCISLMLFQDNYGEYAFQ